MKKVVVASINPVKLNAAKEGFERMFPGETFEFIQNPVPSNVSEQPLSDEETFQGALNRIDNLKKASPDADFWVGIEGGMEEKNGEMEVFAWAIVCSQGGMYGKGRAATFILPPRMTELIRSGMELGAAADVVFDESNSKQNQGTIGILTGNNIDRTKYYVDPMVIALIPFKNPELYQK